MSKKYPRCRKEGKARPHFYVSSSESGLILVAFGKSPCYPSASGLCTGLVQMMQGTLVTHQFNSVQLLSHVRLFENLWTAALQASLSITNTWCLLKLMSIESVMPSNHLILCHPLLLLPSILPNIRVFFNE